MTSQTDLESPSDPTPAHRARPRRRAGHHRAPPGQPGGAERGGGERATARRDLPADHLATSPRSRSPATSASPGRRPPSRGGGDFMIRIAAVGDVHVDKDVVGRYRPALEQLPESRRRAADRRRPDPARDGRRGEVLRDRVRRAGRTGRGGARQPRPPERPGAAGHRGAHRRRDHRAGVLLDGPGDPSGTGSASPAPRASAAGSPGRAPATSANAR